MVPTNEALCRPSAREAERFRGTWSIGAAGAGDEKPGTVTRIYLVRRPIYRATRMDLRSILHQYRCVLLPRVAPLLRDRCAHLVPRPSLSWRAAVQYRQRPYLERHAQARGLTLERYRQRVLSRLQGMLAGAEVRLRVPAEVLGIMLSDGRYKSQFEVDSSRGAFNPGQRQMLEWMTLGIPPSARNQDRPVYGYLSGSLEAGLLQQYGEVVLRLEHDVRWRSTFCMGDSLDSVLLDRRPMIGPTPIGRPELLGVDPRFDLLAIVRPWQAVREPHRYIEVQIHGPLTTTEIGEAVFTHGERPSPEVQELLSGRGIPWRTVEGEGP